MFHVIICLLPFLNARNILIFKKVNQSVFFMKECYFERNGN